MPQETIIKATALRQPMPQEPFKTASQLNAEELEAMQAQLTEGLRHKRAEEEPNNPSYISNYEYGIRAVKAIQDHSSTFEQVLYRLRKISRPYLQNAPHNEKFSLCRCINDTTLQMIHLIHEVRLKPGNKTPLTNLNCAHIDLRSYWYEFYSAGYFNYKKGKELADAPQTILDDEATRKFGVVNREVDHLGRMIGVMLRNIGEAQKFIYDSDNNKL